MDVREDLRTTSDGRERGFLDVATPRQFGMELDRGDKLYILVVLLCCYFVYP